MRATLYSRSRTHSENLLCFSGQLREPSRWDATAAAATAEMSEKQRKWESGRVYNDANGEQMKRPPKTAERRCPRTKEEA